MRKKFPKKLIFTIYVYGLFIVRFLPKKYFTDTETLGLVYNKFKFEQNYANKTR